MDGVNVLTNEDPTLKEWFTGPTLIETLGRLLREDLGGVSLTCRQSRGAVEALRVTAPNTGLERVQRPDSHRFRCGRVRTIVQWCFASRGQSESCTGRRGCECQE